MTLYKIARWAEIYESHETRKLKALRYVFMPNTHDGLAFARLASQPNACELYACWVLIVQVASKGTKDERGILARGLLPLTPADLAIMTRFPAQSFQRALEYFSRSDVGWLEAVDVHVPHETLPGFEGQIPRLPGMPGESPGEPGSSTARIEGRKEGRREGETDGTHTPPALVMSPEQAQELAPGFATTQNGIEEALAAFNDVKANYPGDPRTPEAFRGWLMTSKLGKEIRRRHPFIPPSKTASLSEPDGWRPIAAADPDLSWAAKREWTALLPAHQRQIVELKRKMVEVES